MKAQAAGRRFSALIEPTGVYVIEYRRVRDRIDIIGRMEQRAEIHNTLDAGEVLGLLLGTYDVGPAMVSVGLRGLGSCHHLLVLPPARPDILGSVVTREMRRLYPDFEDPIVEYVSGGRIDRRNRDRPDAGSPPQEVLAAAMERVSVADLEQGLGVRDIAVEHISVLPSIVQKLYDEFGTREEPSAVLMVLGSGLLFAFFYQGQLRLVAEPPGDRTDGAGIDLQVVLEQVERGGLYLRQQFRGAQISRLLVAADADVYAQIAETVSGNMGLEVRTFGGEMGSAAEVAALGVVLEQGDGGLNLFPLSEVKKKSADEWTRRLVISSAVLLAIMAWWWAGNGVAEVSRLRARVDLLQQAVARRAPALQPIQNIVTRRIEHDSRVAVLNGALAETSGMMSLVGIASLAGPAGVRLDAFSITRSGPSWTVGLTATSEAVSASQALSQAHSFYRAVPREVPAESVALNDLQFVAASTPSAEALKFQMTFTAPLVAPAPPPSPAPGN